MVTTFDVTEIFAARNRSLQRFFLLKLPWWPGLPWWSGLSAAA